LIVVREADAQLEGPELLTWLEGKVAKWWIPEDVAFVNAIPHTATGKISKLELRRMFKGYRAGQVAARRCSSESTAVIDGGTT